MLTKLNLIFNTIIHLRFIQIYHQVYYKIRNKLIGTHKFARLEGYEPVNHLLTFDEKAYQYVPNATGIEFRRAGTQFTFLNEPHSFKETSIDWDFESKGKLWNYNLNYFDFLFSPDLSPVQGKELIQDYCNKFSDIVGGNEPFPISLRGINWIKFFSRIELLDDELNKTLYRQYKVLMANVEYHIMANHLMENGFSLLFAAYYFQNEGFYRKAAGILTTELEEQILSDGAHFERSPMYHQIMLFRVLDCINLVKNNSWKSHELLGVLVAKAGGMLFWINEVTFSNGDIPMLKDSAFGIAPDTAWLNDYANRLNIQPSLKTKKLDASGFRKFKVRGMELLADVGHITPTYQPGHAHADETNFILYSNGVPLIVDVGVSTYEKDEKRQRERSTTSHNCVSINSQNSSQVWGGFRVAKRAKVEVLTDEDTEIAVRHNGYSKSGVTISRIFRIVNDSIIINDFVEASAEPVQSELRLHIHPGIIPEFKESGILLGDVCIKMEGFQEVAEESYMFATGFNKLVKGSLLRLSLKSESKLTIENAN